MPRTLLLLLLLGSETSCIVHEVPNFVDLPPRSDSHEVIFVPIGPKHSYPHAQEFQDLQEQELFDDLLSAGFRPQFLQPGEEAPAGSIVITENRTYPDGYIMTYHPFFQIFTLYIIPSTSTDPFGHDFSLQLAGQATEAAVETVFEVDTIMALWAGPLAILPGFSYEDSTEESRAAEINDLRFTLQDSIAKLRMEMPPLEGKR